MKSKKDLKNTGNNRGKFIKGQSGNPTGKPKGTPNKLTKAVKDVFVTVFDDLQEDKEANLMIWAKANLTEFYKLSAKLIPTAVDAQVTTKKLGIDLEEETYE